MPMALRRTQTHFWFSLHQSRNTSWRRLHVCGPLSCFISARTQSTAAGPRGQAPCRPGAFAPALAERPVLQNSVQSSQNSPFRKSPPRHPVYLSAVLTTGQTSQFVVWDSDLCLFPRLKCKLHEDRVTSFCSSLPPQSTRGAGPRAGMQPRTGTGEGRGEEAGPEASVACRGRQPDRAPVSSRSSASPKWSSMAPCW